VRERKRENGREGEVEERAREIERGFKRQRGALARKRGRDKERSREREKETERDRD